MAAAKKMPKGMEMEPTTKKGMKNEMKADKADVAKMKGMTKGKSGPGKKPAMGMGY